MVSDPPERVGHGSKQVQENAEQGIVRFQVEISLSYQWPLLSLRLKTKLASIQVRIQVPRQYHNQISVKSF